MPRPHIVPIVSLASNSMTISIPNSPILIISQDEHNVRSFLSSRRTCGGQPSHDQAGQSRKSIELHPVRRTSSDKRMQTILFTANPINMTCCISRLLFNDGECGAHRAATTSAKHPSTPSAAFERGLMHQPWHAVSRGEVVKMLSTNTWHTFQLSLRLNGDCVCIRKNTSSFVLNEGIL
jgi:hypothetical protein